MKGEQTGGCLCGAVRYILRDGMRLNPYACHCTDCQSRTGTAFSEHMLFMENDIEIEGELDVGNYEQPSGARSRIFGCAACKARIYAVTDNRSGLASLRCGTLDNSAQFVPARHVWVQSKQPWITLPADSIFMDQQPRSGEAWTEFLGIA
ncbi:GFA family protein [Blastomonas sp.]|uniref:GFA family protein n=1 Tax=Blastomonas sp. TaxID=1909299 RepID=UPI0035938112